MSPVIGAGFWRRAAAAQFTIDESTAVSLAQRTRHARLVGLLGHGPRRSTSAGASRPSPARSSATSSEIRGRTDWMPRPPRPSSRCCGRACASGRRSPSASPPPSWRRCSRRVLMPGLPVLIAAVVAIVVGWFNWLGEGGSPDGEPRRRARAGGAAVTLWTAILVAALICVALEGARLPRAAEGARGAAPRAHRRPPHGRAAGSARRRADTRLRPVDRRRRPRARRSSSPEGCCCCGRRSSSSSPRRPSSRRSCGSGAGRPEPRAPPVESTGAHLGSGSCRDLDRRVRGRRRLRPRRNDRAHLHVRLVPAGARPRDRRQRRAAARRPAAHRPTAGRRSRRASA